MAHANDVGSPQPRENNVTGKRKRTGAADGIDEKPQLTDGNDNTQASYHDILQELLEDIIEILKSYDTSSPILHHAIDPPTAEDPHATKKVKLSQPAGSATVTSKVQSRAYGSISQFVKDVDLALLGVIQGLRDQSNSNNPGESASSDAKVQAEMAQAASFKRSLEDILVREMVMRPKAFPAPDIDVHNGVMKDEDQTMSAGWGNHLSSHRQVLTLFGSAPNARQLFSSLQHPSKNSANIESKPLSEWGLPNGIGTTRIVPVHSLDAKVDKPVPTLGELFPQPASLMQLNPPRLSKHTATRSSSVSWVNATEALNSSRNYRRDSYATQPLLTGQWLKYNVPPLTSQLASPETKRKQRDRALSFGEPQPTIPKETVDAHNQKKEDALFRSVYSTFAPSRDNTGATVSQRTKDQLWWGRYGEGRYQAIFNPPSLDDDRIGETTMEVVDVGVQVGSNEAEIEAFKEVVATWQPEEALMDAGRSKEATTGPPETTQEVDEILKEVSELLETLESYQRVRNLSLSNNARTSTGPNTTMSGTPTSPSPAEFDMYNILKSQLTIMVSSLPPWALAKINGEKLGALNVSSRLEVEGQNYKGTMEDDEAVTKTKPISTPTAGYPRAVPPASVPARPSYANTPAQQYQRPGYAQQAATRPPANSSSYLPNQQYSARPASASQYLGTSRSSYAPRPATVSTERYTYTAGQQYNPQAQSTAGGYANGNRSYSNQNASYYGNQYTPSHPAAAHGQRPAQPLYQQRGVDAIAYNYPSGGGKAGSPPQANTAYSPPQRAYAGVNTTPNQPRPNSYNSNAASYVQNPSNAVNGTGSALAAYKSANEQAAFMNRQKAQMEEHRQMSNTPGPASRTTTPIQNGFQGQ